MNVGPYTINEYEEYCAWLDGSINEFQIPQRLQKKIDFLQELTSKTQKSFRELVDIFKDKVVYKFFSAIKWSLSNLYKAVKEGFSLIHTISGAIADYTASTKFGQWNKRELEKLDAFLQKHPKLARASGLAVAGILIFIWLNMSFTGKLDADFDLTDMVKALQGNYSIADIFAGKEGYHLLMLFASGVFMGVSFPWPGPTAPLFISAVVSSIIRARKK